MPVHAYESCTVHAVARYCVAEEENSVQAANKEGVLSKCDQITQNGNCNSMSVFEVSNQLKVMEIGTEDGNKENIPGVALPKRLSIEPSFAVDWLEISWDELDLKERIGAGTSLPPGFLLT